ncbi:trypco2 family protein [Jannaschia helgolandensis]|uniref:trypco2 family protein n=1 Tax=Jannaschia helgolandensis TaxID=188906 RepID=UPI0030DA4390|tara:strand:+ start:114 stop:533 length:420 start_codon:yes stop_codon:yes gene_type:complete
MEIKDFIVQAVRAVCDATVELKTHYKGTKVFINPYADDEDTRLFSPGVDDRRLHKIHDIEFDIAVTASREASGSAIAKISVLGADLGGDGERTVGTSAESRIRFTLPVALPHTFTAMDHGIVHAHRNPNVTLIVDPPED